MWAAVKVIQKMIASIIISHQYTSGYQIFANLAKGQLSSTSWSPSACTALPIYLSLSASLELDSAGSCRLWVHTVWDTEEGDILLLSVLHVDTCKISTSTERKKETSQMPNSGKTSSISYVMWGSRHMSYNKMKNHSLLFIGFNRHTGAC